MKIKNFVVLFSVLFFVGIEGSERSGVNPEGRTDAEFSTDKDADAEVKEDQRTNDTDAKENKALKIGSKTLYNEAFQEGRKYFSTCPGQHVDEQSQMLKWANEGLTLKSNYLHGKSQEKQLKNFDLAELGGQFLTGATKELGQIVVRSGIDFIKDICKSGEDKKRDKTLKDVEKMNNDVRISNVYQQRLLALFNLLAQIKALPYPPDKKQAIRNQIANKINTLMQQRYELFGIELPPNSQEEPSKNGLDINDLENLIANLSNADEADVEEMELEPTTAAPAA